MGNKYIHNLIAQGENQQLDFKYEISDAKKIARTFSAFANTVGGKLLIGVRDNGSVAGVKTDEEAYMIESAAHIYCKPSVEYNLKSWVVDGKTVLEVSIEESKTKPHTAPWKGNLWRAFIRIHDENFVAKSVQVEVWKKFSKGKPTLIKYNQNERLLMGFLRKNDEISLNGFCRLSKLKYHTAKRILVNLVAIGIIKINYTEQAVTYSLNEMPG
jgi:hypothetical protein